MPFPRRRRALLLGPAVACGLSLHPAPRAAAQAPPAPEEVLPMAPDAAPAGTARPLRPDERAAMTGVVWTPDCPVPLDALVVLELPHHDGAGGTPTGRLVVHRDVADDLLGVFARLFAIGFPIPSMQPAETFGGDDDASMAANNTVAFHCRKVAGTQVWSEHASGRALDLNPLWNPWVRPDPAAPDGLRVAPEAGRAWALTRSDAPGLILPDGPVVQAFAAIGWGWGGTWRRARDLQHFSASGR
ncbi:MAG: M15 family metallopeptidase [Alphaproteobacteria bacterium]|nr:M15 family metallopeptidase [Alphaproteobacteria bacterium]